MLSNTDDLVKSKKPRANGIGLRARGPLGSAPLRPRRENLIKSTPDDERHGGGPVFFFFFRAVFRPTPRPPVRRLTRFPRPPSEPLVAFAAPDDRPHGAHCPGELDFSAAAADDRFRWIPMARFEGGKVGIRPYV